MAENLADWPTARWIFLEALAEAGNVSAAARTAGMSRQTAYERRNGDPAFARDWDDALEVACDALEAEARRRAMAGTERPVFYQGGECGAVKVFSDTLMIVLLKAHRPGKFRENSTVEHDGQVTIRVEYADSPGCDGDDAHDPAPEAAPAAG